MDDLEGSRGLNEGNERADSSVRRPETVQEEVLAGERLGRRDCARRDLVDEYPELSRRRLGVGRGDRWLSRRVDEVLDEKDEDRSPGGPVDQIVRDEVELDKVRLGG